MTKTTYYQINSIIKVFGLIEVLVSKNEFDLSELTSQLNLPKTTVHRMLLTLQSLGYVKQNPQNLRYSASIKFFELGREVMRKSNVLEFAHPHMVRLAAETGETINLGVLDGLDVVCIHKVESRYYLRQDQPIGTRTKAYCTSFGKAMLAFCPEQDRRQLYSQEALVRCTPNSLQTREAIEEELKLVRAKGFAVDNEEGVLGVRCVGAPILDHEAKVVAGLSIAGPALRIGEDDIPRLAELVMEAATAISRSLGYPS